MTADPRDIELLMARHKDVIYVDAGNEMKPAFPYVTVGGDGLQVREEE